MALPTRNDHPGELHYQQPFVGNKKGVNHIIDVACWSDSQLQLVIKGQSKTEPCQAFEWPRKVEISKAQMLPPLVGSIDRPVAFVFTWQLR